MEGNILIIKHVEKEGAGLIEEVFSADTWELNTIELGLGGRLPENIEGIAGIVILGGPMNVYEEGEYPFLKEEEKVIRKALIEEVPLLGICLGAQLLAKTCGAAVRKAPVKEIGWYSVDISAEGKKDLLFRGCQSRLKVFQWHEDTFDIPEGGAALATGKTCRNQALRVGSSAYGLQFHLEVTPAMVEDWMESERERMSIGKILHDTGRLHEVVRKQAIQLFGNFKQIVESSLRIKRVMKIFVEDEKESRKKRSLLWWSMKDHALLPMKT